MIFLAFHVVLVVLSDLFGTFDDGSGGGLIPIYVIILRARKE